MRKKKAIGVSIAAITIALSLVFTSGCAGLGIISMIGCAGCAGSIVKEILEDNKDDYDVYRPETRPSHEYETPARGDNDEYNSSIRYEEYDPTEFNEKCKQLTSLAEGNDFDKIADLYTELYNEIEYIDENSSMLFVLYSEDVTDAYYSEQYVANTVITTELYDNLLTSIKAVCDGPSADKFKDYVGETYFNEYDEYEPLTDDQLAWKERESELVDEYNTALANGQEDGTPDSELNKILGGIYVELVQLRTNIAASYGYDNYADFADENIFCRDFNGDEIKVFCDSIKKVSSDVYSRLYYSTAGYASYLVDCDKSASELLGELTKDAALLSPYTKEAAEKLTAEHLYSIGSDPNRREGAYTITFEKSKKPFIFAKVGDDPSDFISLSHEFGHFTADSVHSNPNILLYGYGSLELSEVHSNGLQALFTKYYSDVYGDDAGIMAAHNILDLLENVTDGCLMDEFQRIIYHNPDMTLDQINTLYRDLCKEYGLPTQDNDYWWMYVGHNFESPMYYISYAASGIVALQIWSYTLNDYDKAVRLWEEIVENGSYGKSYMEVLSEIGLSSFTKEPAVLMTCRQALAFIDGNSFSLNY